MPENFIVGVAVGSGLVATAAQRGGADFLLAINAGRMRNMGTPSVAGMLPIGDATRITESFAMDEVLSQCSIPVFIGVNVMGSCNDPALIIDRVEQQGFDGVVNFPTCIHYPPSVQHILERGQRGIAREVDVLVEAKKRGLKTLFYCANRSQARLGADAGLDMILLNFGWNAGGALGHNASQTLEEAAFQTTEIRRLVKRIQPDTRFLLEGGPIVTSEDLEHVVKLAEVDGYVGGSTIERLPLENTIANLIAGYRLSGSGRTNTQTSHRHLTLWAKELGTAGQSPVLLRCLEQLQRMGSLSAPVLLRHPPGADIAWALRALENSPRSGGGVHVLRPGLEDKHGTAGRRLFGVLRDGTERPGALNDPNCGTVVIHAPERLSPRTQRRLARALQEGRFMAPGSRRWRQLHARCVFTSDSWANDIAPENLESLLVGVLQSRYIDIPPLKERAEDLQSLISQRYEVLGLDKRSRPQLQSAVLWRLLSHEWPGNEQELHTFLDKLALMRGSISAEQIEQLLEQEEHPLANTTDSAQTEKARIVEALWRNSFHRSRTAKALGISRKTLYNKIQRYGLSD